MALFRRSSESEQKTQSSIKYSPPNLVVTIDVASVLFKEYYGIKTTLSYNGMRTEIIYGFLNSLMLFFNTFKTTNMVFCFDSKGSLRRRKYRWYKNRELQTVDEKTQQHDKEIKELFEQFKIIEDYIIPTMGFKNTIARKGFEADDLIASVVMNNRGPHLVISSDKDLYQLLHICNIYDHRKREIFTDKWFKDTYEITPQQWVDVKKLAGCISDKVPGIKGIGEKTAIKYIKNELRAGKKLDSIKEDIYREGDESIYHRNDYLVRLPLPELKPVKVNFDEQMLDLDGFKDICLEYGFQFLSRRDTKDNWYRFFQNKKEQ